MKIDKTKKKTKKKIIKLCESNGLWLLVLFLLQ